VGQGCPEFRHVPDAGWQQAPWRHGENRQSQEKQHHAERERRSVRQTVEVEGQEVGQKSNQEGRQEKGGQEVEEEKEKTRQPRHLRVSKMITSTPGSFCCYSVTQ